MGEDIPACGLGSSKRNWSAAKHKVSLVYASAIPVNSYMNMCGRDQVQFQTDIAEQILVAQYYGALKTAARRSRGGKTKVFLMPLGGGVFGNPWEIIARGMSTALEMLEKKELDGLDVRV